MIAALTIGVFTPALAQSQPLLSPFPVSTLNESAPEKFSCREKPKAVRNLEFSSMYNEEKEIDTDALDEYRDDVEPVRAFERYLDTLITAYNRNPAQGGPYAHCAAAWLYRWASGEALLGTVNEQGVAVRKWALAAIASSYLQIRHDTAIPADQKRIIEGWINLLAQTVRNDYSRGEEKESRNNNHVYWAAWAVMASAVILNDREMFDWSATQYRKGVDGISPEGTLPLEMKRKAKAFYYHIYAAGPLVMMAETAQKNGIDLYGYNNAALHRLAHRVVTELDTNQSLITKQAGTAQDLTNAINGSSLAWLAPYHARFQNINAAPWMEKLAPLHQRRLGGNLGQLYEKSSDK